MFCKKCGTENSDKAQFCCKCGQPLTHSNNSFSNTSDSNQMRRRYNPYNQGQNTPRQNGYMPLLITIIIILVISLCVLCFVLYKNSQDDSAKPQVTATPTAAPTATPTATPQPTAQPTQHPLPTSTPGAGNNEVVNPSYLTFSDSVAGITCEYPSHFVRVNTSSQEDRLVMHSPDNRIQFAIRAQQNSYNVSAGNAMNSYISSITGTVGYQANGDTWYALSYDRNGIRYYRKCFVDTDKIRWFDMNYPIADNDICDAYINYIEDHFKRI